MHEAIMASAALGICLVSTIWNWEKIKKEKEFIKELKTVSTAYDFIKKGFKNEELKQLRVATKHSQCSNKDTN